MCIYHIIPYLSHILSYFLSFAYIVYLIYFILFLVSCSLQVSYTFMFLSFHVRILCMYHILSYLIYFHITYLILFYTFIYILILFIYGTFVCFHLVLFMYCTFICFHTYNLHMLMQSYTFLSDHVSFQVVYIFLLFLVNIVLYFTSCSCNCILSLHSSDMFSYHVIYSLHFICIYLSFSFMFHVCKYLRSGYGK